MTGEDLVLIGVIVAMVAAGAQALEAFIKFGLELKNMNNVDEWLQYPNHDKLKNSDIIEHEKRKNSDIRVGDHVRTPDGEWAEVVADDHAPLSDSDMAVVRRLSKPKLSLPLPPAPSQPEHVPYIEEPIKFTIKPSGDHWLAEHTLGSKPTPKDVEYSMQRRMTPRPNLFLKTFSIYQDYVKAMRKYFNIGLMTDTEWLNRSTKTNIDPEVAYRSTVDNLKQQYDNEQRSALDKWTYRSFAYDPKSYGVSAERLAQMRGLLPAARRHIYWYTTRLAMDQFCTTNKIPRRFDQHWDAWISANHIEYENRDDIGKTKLESVMSDAVVNEWITSSPLRGASDWPVNLYGVPIRYVPGHVLPYTITDHNEAFPFLFLLADFSKSEATAITHTGQIYRFEILPEMLESIPYDLDLDGNPEYDGHIYSYPIRIDKEREAAERLSDAIGRSEIELVDLTTPKTISTGGVQYDLTPEEQERLDRND